MVPTPIGNLGDITLRALEVLKAVSLIAAEDTRRTGLLLKHYNIKNKLISYHKFNESQRTQKLLEMVQNGFDIAIVSDAGSPGISDPAMIIVKKATAQNIQVIALPGATAFVPAITASGLDCERFSFWGFIPPKGSAQKSVLTQMASASSTLICYETPKRLAKTSTLLMAVLGNRKVVIAKEISKIFEEYIHSDLQSLAQDSLELKGELVLVIDAPTTVVQTPADIDAMIMQGIADGLSPKLIAHQLKEKLQCTKSHIYQRALELRDK